MVQIFKLRTTPNGVAKSSDVKEFLHFQLLYKSILGAGNPLKEAIQVDSNIHSRSKLAFRNLVSAFVTHLNICYDQEIAIQLLETLSVFSIAPQGIATVEMVRLSWKALQSKYSNGAVLLNFQVPFAFLAALKKLVPSALSSSAEKNAAERAVYDTIVKLAFRKSRIYEKNSFLLHGMLRHWGLLALSMGNTGLFYEHLYQIFSNLQNFLVEVKEPSATNLIISRGDDTSDEDGEYIPPFARREYKVVLPSSEVPGLGDVSFAIYYDILLQMTISAIAIFSVSRQSKEGAFSTPSGPFRELEYLFEIYGKMIELYMEKIRIFPRGIFSVVLKASKCLLSVTMYQLRDCVSWRNSQPVHPTENGMYTNDPASIKFLEMLLDVIGMNVVGKLLSFCKKVDYISGGSNHFGAGGSQSLKPLRIGSARVRNELQRIAQAYNLAEPKTNQESLQLDKRITRARGLVASRPERLKTQALKLAEEPNGSLPSDYSARLPPSDDEGRISASSEPTIEDYSVSDSSEAFGVSGDWGKESDCSEDS